MNINRQINRLLQEIRLRETANDSYYLSRQYQEDHRALYELRKLQNKKTYLQDTQKKERRDI